MHQHQGVWLPGGEDRGTAERESLHRFCARFTGDADAAEDLAQQTLLEAWRHEQGVRDPQARRAWLFRIARNLCVTWARGRRRALAHLSRWDEDEGTTAEREGWPAATVDIELELERADLARLLDRAMALLPPATRTVLVARYIHESPQAEVAARLGLSEGTVEARLRRGTVALRRVLLTDFAEEAAAYGPRPDGAGAWKESRIWCPSCGARRLRGQCTAARIQVRFRCPAGDGPESYHHITSPRLFVGITGYKSALSRMLRATRALHRQASASPTPPCPECGRPTPVTYGVSAPGLRMRCAHCGCAYERNMTALILALPEGQWFWRNHPRLSTHLGGRIEAAGTPALVTSLRSRTGAATLDVVFALATYAVVAIGGAGLAGPRGEPGEGEGTTG